VCDGGVPCTVGLRVRLRRTALRATARASRCFADALVLRIARLKLK
jgi:hypothetical protein